MFAFAPQPERISGEQYGIHADVWSVGISFMEVRQCMNDFVPYLPSVLREKFRTFVERKWSIYVFFVITQFSVIHFKLNVFRLTVAHPLSSIRCKCSCACASVSLFISPSSVD